MGKKKRSAVSNRVYATVSVPSKKASAIEPETPAHVEKESEKPDLVKPKPLRPKITPTPPLEQPEPREDKVQRLVKRYATINDRKVEQLCQQVAIPPPHDDNARPFALSDALEHDLLQVLRHQGRIDTFGMVIRRASSIKKKFPVTSLSISRFQGPHGEATLASPR